MTKFESSTATKRSSQRESKRKVFVWVKKQHLLLSPIWLLEQASCLRNLLGSLLEQAGLASIQRQALQ